MRKTQTVPIDGPHKILKLNDTYNFDCERCGTCCTSPGYFTPETLRKAAEFLNLSPQEFFQTYCTLKAGDTVIRPSKKGKRCSLIKGVNSQGVCTIHPVKPPNCGYAPLVARTVPFDDETLVVTLDETTDFALCECPGVGQGPELRIDDVVRATLQKDATAQNLVLKQTLEIMGQRYIQILDLKREEQPIPQDLATELKQAVKQVYGLE